MDLFFWLEIENITEKMRTWRGNFDRDKHGEWEMSGV